MNTKMKTKNYTYSNGIGTNVEDHDPNCYNRSIIQIEDGRFFYSKTNTHIPLDYVESKDCYEIVKTESGREIAVNLCNGFAYSFYK